jgi:outer membrane lipoprotein-sorting protein
MFLSTLLKFLLACCSLSLVLTGCGSTGTRTPENSAIVVENEKPPAFPSKDPEAYRGMLVITARNSERKIFLARSGALRRMDIDPSGQRPLTLLVRDKEYLINGAEGIHAVRPTGAAGPPQMAFVEDLTRRLLTARERASVELLEESDGISRYRVRPEHGENFESIVYVDNSAGIPVKQEFYSLNNGEGYLQYSVEFRDLKLDASGVSFDLPDDSREVSLDEFYRRLRR